MRVQIVVFDGFDELDAIAPFEVLKTAAEVGADVRVELVTLDGASEVAAAHGLRIRPEGRLDPDERPDVLVVPGGGWNSRASKGAWGESQRGKLPEAIARLHDVGTTVATVCTGGMLAQAAGLTSGRPATTHHGAVEEMRASGTEVVVDARVVDDGDLITAGGVTSGLDLALWLVERHFGVDVALSVQSEMEYERRGTVAGAEGSSFGVS